MHLRPYGPGDLSMLGQLFYDTVHRVNVRDYTPEQLDAWADGHIDVARWHESLSAHDTLVAEAEGALLGFADMDETGYLDRPYVHADHQGEGVASALCAALEQRARARGVRRFTTHASLTARPFFQRRGWRVLREQQVERQGVTLTNFVMEKKI